MEVGKSDQQDAVSEALILTGKRLNSIFVCHVKQRLLLNEMK
jgi:hypothetical protein